MSDYEVTVQRDHCFVVSSQKWGHNRSQYSVFNSGANRLDSFHDFDHIDFHKMINGMKCEM